MEEHLVLNHLWKSFGAVQAVRDICLRFKRGELVTLLGPSGCGKTTTLHMIAGFHLPDRGAITLAGRDITYLPAYHRNTPMVFQEYALFPHLTVFENLAYGLKIQKKDRSTVDRKVRQILEQLELPAIADRFPNQLSGGQQQRIALGRALVLDPEVLLLDEPLSNLDAKLRIQIRYEIKRLQEKFRITMIYVTHDQEEALSISDQVAVMNQGRVEQYGTPWEIYHNPGNPFVAGFVGETNLLPVKVVALKVAGDHLYLEMKWRDKTLRLPTDGYDLRHGTDKNLVLRPENIGIAKPDAGTDRNPLFAGIVKQCSFLGAITRYWIDIGGQEIIVDDSQTGQHGLYDGAVTLSYTGGGIHLTEAPE